MLDSSLLTGIEIIDREHEQLFDTIDKLKNIKRDPDEFLETVIVLENYVRDHFATEEGYMKNLGYPFYDAHKMAHEKFYTLYRDFLSKIPDTKNILDLAPELISFLLEWVKEHYRTEDVKMAVFLKKHIG